MSSFKTGKAGEKGREEPEGFYFVLKFFILFFFFQNALTKRKKRNIVSTSANGYSHV